MHKINLKRNDKCLCGSNLKFKKCCGLKGNIEFYELTDIDFLIVNDFNSSIPIRNKSNVYHSTFKSFQNLETLCIDYKEKIIGKLNLDGNKDILYKYVFKKILKEDENNEDVLFLCGLKEIGDGRNININVVKDNLSAANIIIESLNSVIIPNELYEKQEERILEETLKRNNINLIYQEN